MQNRHYYSSQNFRVFYASITSGLKTRIEKTEDAINRLREDVNRINLKYINSTGENGENAGKKLKKIEALIEQLEALNAHQRTTMAEMLRSQEPARPKTGENFDDFGGLV